jgi:regulator of sigma D
MQIENVQLWKMCNSLIVIDYFVAGHFVVWNMPIWATSV